MTDLLIRGATVIDGTGAPGVRASVVVDRGRIAASGRAGAAVATADRVLDADGLALAPGLHRHALARRLHAAVLPGGDQLPQPGRDQRRSSATAATHPRRSAADAGLRRASGRPMTTGIGPDLDWAWRTFGEYLGPARPRRGRRSTVLPAGRLHGMLRVAVVGTEERAATAGRDRRHARRAAAAALAAGAWGMSTGLVYPPGAYAVTDEIIEVGRGACRRRRACTPRHIRNEADDLPTALDEAIEIGRSARRPGRDLPPQGGRTAEPRPCRGGRCAHRRRARAAGAGPPRRLPVRAGSTFLSQLLPPWVHDGGDEAMHRSARLRPRSARRIAAERRRAACPAGRTYIEAAGGWDGILIASRRSTRRCRWLEGQTVAELAAERGHGPVDAGRSTLMAADRGGAGDDRRR